MSIVMGWLARSRKRGRQGADPQVISHPTTTFVIGLACFVLFGSMLVISNVVPNETTTRWTTSVFLGFTLLSVPLITDYFLVHHRVDENGLSYRNCIGRAFFMRWDEVADVQFAQSLKWFRIRSRTGKIARVSAMMMGLQLFARTLLENVPAEAIDPNSLEILDQTASGNPPAIWG
jgi:hypothetical protein